MESLFYTQEYDPDGVYAVWLNINGEWKLVVVDDQIPCQSSGVPAFSRAHGEELWVILLEKAYAKAYGCYQRIEGGNPAEALRDLTGAPYENFEGLCTDDLWTKLNDSSKQGFLLTCYSKATMQTEEENELGILSNHAYAILQLAAVKDNQNQNARILQIRNVSHPTNLSLALGPRRVEGQVVR